MMTSKAREVEESDSDDGERSATKDGEAKQKEVFAVNGVPLHYRQEAGDKISSGISRTAENVSLFEESAHFWSKGSLYGDVLSHVRYEGQGDVSTRHPS